MTCIFFFFFLQVLSNTVAAALRWRRQHDLSQCLTDCLNVADFDSRRHSRNPFKAPYRSGEDFRLKVRSWILLTMYMKNSIVLVIWWYVCPRIVAGRGVPPISWCLGRECGWKRRIFRYWKEEDDLKHRDTPRTAYYRLVQCHIHNTVMVHTHKHLTCTYVFL